MKIILYGTLLAALVWLTGCSSTEEEAVVEPVTMTPGGSAAAFDTTGQRLVSMGMFMNNVHPTSGTVRVYERNGVRTLVFSNFRTDPGPDLRIYVAENTSLRNFAEVSRLNQSGNFSVQLPADANPGRQRFVLIWCKAFSVLFGNAELK